MIYHQKRFEHIIVFTKYKRDIFKMIYKKDVFGYPKYYLGLGLTQSQIDQIQATFTALGVQMTGRAFWNAINSLFLQQRV